MLDLSKIEAGQLTLSLADYSIKDVVHGVIDAVEPLAIEKHLALKIDLPTQLPKGHGDERRLAQVLLNLVGNAIKFTDRGRGGDQGVRHQRAFTRRRCATPGRASPRPTRRRSSRSSSRPTVPSRARRAAPGSDLSIAKRIVELHGGRIWVEFELGQGIDLFRSRFRSASSSRQAHA